MLPPIGNTLFAFLFGLLFLTGIALASKRKASFFDPLPHPHILIFSSLAFTFGVICLLYGANELNATSLFFLLLAIISFGAAHGTKRQLKAYGSFKLFYYQLMIGVLALLPVLYFKDYTLTPSNVGIAALIGLGFASYPLFRSRNG